MRRHLAERILVTGGSGFLGSHLCDRLLAEGAEVLCVDNFFTGTRRNIEHLIGNPRFELMRHDITFSLFVEVDQIYNLACPASPIHYQHDPVQTTKTSVNGAINMLGLAKRLKVRILQASTSEVYGDPITHPQTEDYWGNVNPIGLRSCYDEGKRCAETLFFDYWRQHRLPIKVARIFNTYGPRMHPNDGRVVSNFIVQALLGRDITIYGDGSQTRAFCYVDDMIDGLIRLMKTPETVTGPLNIGNPHEVAIRDLATQIIALMGSRSRIVHRPAAGGRPAPAATGHLTRPGAAGLGAADAARGRPRPHHRVFRKPLGRAGHSRVAGRLTLERGRRRRVRQSDEGLRALMDSRA
jgi:UDP-glucuronate decarboxylase